MRSDAVKNKNTMRPVSLRHDEVIIIFGRNIFFVEWELLTVAWGGIATTINWNICISFEIDI